jgi:surface protein
VTCHESPPTAVQLPRSNRPLLRRLQQSTLLAVISVLLSTRVDCLTAITNANIGTAVTAWATDPTTAAATYGDIADWTTAEVTSMRQLFKSELTFNSNIGAWNVASVSNMASMFEGATAFNVNIGSWNTARVTNMWGMFKTASVFNLNIASWNVLEVTTLTSAFSSTGALSSCNKGAIYRLWGATLRAAYPSWSSESSACLIDGNIGTAATAWATDPTTAAATYGDIADWNTAEVTSMYQLFYSKPTFNADISKWNTASVTRMANMFQVAPAFNGNIGAWNTASVSTIRSMIYGATAFNVNIGAWNTASVVGMVTVFYGATAFNQNIVSWNTASVSNMAGVRSLLLPIAMMCGVWALL